MGMLVLSRKADEGVTITVPPSAVQQQILVKVIEIRGDKARIGYYAPQTVRINRDEIEALLKPPAEVRPLLRIGEPLVKDSDNATT